jgi:hypothetical protein
MAFSSAKSWEITWRALADSKCSHAVKTCSCLASGRERNACLTCLPVELPDSGIPWAFMQVMSDGRTASRAACWLLPGLLVARGILEEVAVGSLEPEAAGAGVLDEPPAAHPADTTAARISTAASADRRPVSDVFMIASLPSW